jgi:hypothetical protein
VIVAEALVLEQLVKIGLHECLYNVDILHVIVGRRAKNVKDINDLMATDQTHDKYHQHDFGTYVFVMKSCQNFDFPQSSLTVGLMLKGTNLLDGNLLSRLIIES